MLIKLPNQKPLLGDIPLWTPNEAGIPPPVGAWIMNEGSGDFLAELINRANGSPVSMTDIWVPSSQGVSVDLLGDVGDHISCLMKSVFALSGSFSIVARCYPRDDDTWRCIFECGDAGLTQRYAMWLNADRLYCVIDNTYLNEFKAGTQENVWQDFAVTHESGGDNTYFIDGVNLGTTTPGDDPSPTASANLRIGIDRNLTFRYDGLINFLFVYDYTLSPIQVAYLHQHPYYAWEYPEVYYVGTTTPPTTPSPTTPSPTTAAPTTSAPTTAAPTTLAPTTLPPTTLAPTTAPPTTPAPTTAPPTTAAPTTPAPTTAPPTTAPPTTSPPTTAAPTTVAPTTPAPTTPSPTTLPPTTPAPTTGPVQTTVPPTTIAPTTPVPTTAAPTTAPPLIARRRGPSNLGYSHRDVWR